MIHEDNNGFINFPNPKNPKVSKMETGKTFIYIVAFDPQDVSNTAYELSNTRLLMTGSFVADDVVQRQKLNTDLNLDQMIESVQKDKYDGLYFPNLNKFVGDNLNNEEIIQKLTSIPMMSCICVGWDKCSYDLKDFGPWFASFRDLTNEGRKLYYSMKKLHNTKEVRILTFNNI